MVENKSIRSRLIALQPGGRLTFLGEKESTIRNMACVIGSLQGKKFKVRKYSQEKIMVYRYE